MEQEHPTPAESGQPLSAERQGPMISPEGPLSGGQAVARPPHQLNWMVMGPGGLRAGWSVLLFVFITVVILFAAGSTSAWFMKSVAHVKLESGSAVSAIFAEALAFIAMLAAVAIVAAVEHRQIVDYNLRGSGRIPYFVGGLVAGFATLSALLGVMAAGGWVHFGSMALLGGSIVRYAALWAFAFLLVGLVEEGSFRGYLQFTLTRGINFWWALAVEAAVCLDLLLQGKGNGVWGVYGLALLGLVPCALLQFRGSARNSFWQAAWVTSTLFGFVHTGNNGENWIGIFAAGAIGFVFCVSIWITGSAWWAIGCHAGWDWAETYFYGTADSGMTAKGHLLTTTPAGSVLWSGGTDGPEGSLLVLPIIALLLLFLVLVYGRRARAQTLALAQSSAE